MKKIVLGLTLLLSTSMFVNSQTENLKRFQEALDSIDTKAYHHSIPILKELIKKDYEAEANYELLVSVYMITDSIDNGIKHVEEAHKRFPENSQFLKYSADLYYKKGDLENAIFVTEKAVVLEPNNDILYAFLGNLYTDKKNYDKAVYNYDEALKCNAKNIMAQYGIATLYVEKSATLQRQMVEEDLDDASYDAYKKEVNLLNEKAIIALEKTFDLDNTNTAVLATLVDFYARTEKMEKFKKAKEKLKALRGY